MNFSFSIKWVFNINVRQPPEPWSPWLVHDMNRAESWSFENLLIVILYWESIFIFQGRVAECLVIQWGGKRRCCWAPGIKSAVSVAHLIRGVLIWTMDGSRRSGSWCPFVSSKASPAGEHVHGMGGRHGCHRGLPGEIHITLCIQTGIVFPAASLLHFHQIRIIIIRSQPVFPHCFLSAPNFLNSSCILLLFNISVIDVFFESMIFPPIWLDCLQHSPSHVQKAK